MTYLPHPKARRQGRPGGGAYGCPAKLHDAVTRQHAAGWSITRMATLAACSPLTVKRIIAENKEAPCAH